MPRKPSKYQERIKVLRKQADRGSNRAMEELHKRYHINEMMINGEVISLKDRFVESPSRF
ncbi:MAG: hypothetical protein WBF13_03205 [Candidatus Zixiibacteriota bacterium]